MSIEAGINRMRDLQSEGTRFKHLSEFLDDIRDAEQVMKELPAYRKTADVYKEQFAQLQAGIKLLEGALASYSNMYGLSWKWEQEVENIHFDSTKIEGGRGTPLYELYPHLKPSTEHLNE